MINRPTELVVVLLGSGGLLFVWLIMHIQEDHASASIKGLNATRPSLVCQEDIDCPNGMMCLGHYRSKIKTCEITCVDDTHDADCPEGMECWYVMDGVEADNTGVCFAEEPTGKRSAFTGLKEVVHGGFPDGLQVEISKSNNRPVVYCQVDADCPVGMSCLEYHDLSYKTCEFICSRWGGRCPTDMECFANRHGILSYTQGTCEPVIYRRAP